MYGSIACTCTDDILVKVIIVYKQLLQISIINDWNLKFLVHLGRGLRVYNAPLSVTLTTLYFMYTQDRDIHRTIYG